MTDAPILGGLNHVTDLDAADDFQKKHTPHITTEQVDGGILLSAKVGHYVAHPNQPDHFIQWIELLVDDAPIVRFELSPVAVNPHVSAVLAVESGTIVRAVAYCNLHGLWAAEVTV